MGSISLENFDREAASGSELRIDSPRSLYVCQSEGVDPAVDLVLLTRAEALRYASNDKVVAERRLAWWRSRRDALLERLLARRQAVIDGSEPMGDRLKMGRGSPSGVLDESTALRSGRINPKQAGAGKLEKIRQIIDANETKEKRQIAYLLETQVRQAEITAMKEADAERKDEELRIQAAMARKRDLDMRDRLVMRELRRAEEEAVLKVKQEEKARALEQEEASLQEKIAERREALSRKKEEKQLQQREKLERVARQTLLLKEIKAEEGLIKLEEERIRLEELRRGKSESLRQRRTQYEERTALLHRKKALADKRAEEKAMRLAESLQNAEKEVLQRQAGMSQARLHRNTELSAREEERQRAYERAKARAAEKAQFVAQHLASEDERLQRWKESLGGDRDLRRFNKKLEEEERQLEVSRVKRMQEYSQQTVERRAMEKAQRIEALRAEQRRLENERLTFQCEVERTKAMLSLPDAARSPGPQDYDVVASERALLPNSPVTHIGMSMRPRAYVDLSPGPGHYSLPPVRKAKGAALPPWKGKMSSLGGGEDEFSRI